MDVLLQSKYPPIVKPNPLEDPVTIEKTVVKNRNLRLILINQLAV